MKLALKNIPKVLNELQIKNGDEIVLKLKHDPICHIKKECNFNANFKNIVRSHLICSAKTLEGDVLTHIPFKDVLSVKKNKDKDKTEKQVISPSLENLDAYNIVKQVKEKQIKTDDLILIVFEGISRSGTRTMTYRFKKIEDGKMYYTFPYATNVHGTYSTMELNKIRHIEKKIEEKTVKNVKAKKIEYPTELLQSAVGLLEEIDQTKEMATKTSSIINVNESKCPDHYLHLVFGNDHALMCKSHKFDNCKPMMEIISDGSIRLRLTSNETPFMIINNVANASLMAAMISDKKTNELEKLYSK